VRAELDDTDSSVRWRIGVGTGISEARFQAYYVARSSITVGTDTQNART
jgi:hypothetical protein